MKKAKVTFLPIEGAGILHLDFYPGPFGDAVESKNGDGVGFFSATGELLGVSFDEVSEKKDRQELIFDRYRIEATVQKGKVTYSVEVLEPKKLKSKKVA